MQFKNGFRQVPPCLDKLGNQLKSESQPISRVLSWTTIHLGYALPHTSSNLPGNSAGHTIVPLFGLAPSGVYLAAERYRRRGALLPHHFNLTGAPKGT
ncbi:hypothetical protein MNBD_GAMMA18-1977 [hydrothermal vent metagenome]|uniref:Uncharacterized protein n=1 Tax=hydrothermal vent metagenome TaxID=652676 RepID=A0A3B0ZC24_9ZZZZ